MSYELILPRACHLMAISWCYRQRQRRLARGQTEKANSEAPVSADFWITALGVTSEAFQDSLRKYVRTNPDMALDTTVAVNKKVKPKPPPLSQLQRAT